MSIENFTPETKAEREIWAFMTEHRRFAYDDIAAATSTTIKGREDFYKKLRDLGILKRCGQEGHRHMFTVMSTEDTVKFAAKKRCTDQAALWASMRIMGVFSPDDLELTLSARTPKIERTEIVKYCSQLLSAGYLVVVQKANHKSKRPARYRLAKNTGPLPPQMRQLRVMVDQNEERASWINGVRL